MSDQVPLLASEPDRKPELSQWFTPPALAKRIVDWALEQHATYMSVLEPSAGIGSLALALRFSDRPVAIGSPVCVEIDPVNAQHLRNLKFETIEGDFLTMNPEGAIYRQFDLAVMNPPFEGGQTEKHIMHALKFATRVVCHCPLTTLAGKARLENMWSKVQLHRLAICSARPKYGADGGKTDMCTIDVTIRDPRESHDATDIEWW